MTGTGSGPLLRRIDHSGAFAFGVFALWLADLPMDGALLRDSAHMLYFLSGHVAAMIALALLWRHFVPALGIAGTLLSALGTLIYPLLPAPAAGALMAALGISAAPMLVHLGQRLQRGPAPLLNAMLGIGCANLLLPLFQQLPLPASAACMVLAAALVLTLPRTSPLAALPNDRDGLATLARYLPFIFLFQIVSGLMYGAMLPAYAEQHYLAGLELAFYASGIFTALHLLRHNTEVLLLCGAATATTAFTVFSFHADAIMVNLGLFAMMFAAGMIDTLLMAMIFSCTNSVRAMGYGIAVLCGGILAGKLLGLAVGDPGQRLSVFASLVLNLAIVIFYLKRPRTASHDTPTQAATLHARLSEKEAQVLAHVIQGKTYRETAETLNMSESTVKTHMQRIFRKAGVINRRQLLEISSPISDLDGHPRSPGS